jgi:hypothetical protein
LPCVGLFASVLRCVANERFPLLRHGMERRPHRPATHVASRQTRKRPGTRPTATAPACSRTTRCANTRSLFVVLRASRTTLVLASFSSHCAVACQSSLLSSFQQILTACGGTPITGSACPVSTPGAAPPSAPPLPAVTSVTAVWAYAVRVDASTIAVRR